MLQMVIGVNAAIEINKLTETIEINKLTETIEISEVTEITHGIIKQRH